MVGDFARRNINALGRNTYERRKIIPFEKEQWKDYYSNLLEKRREDYLKQQLDLEITKVNRVNAINVQEIRTALEKMKNNKAP